MFCKAFVVTQVVVYLRHNDEERSEGQAKAQQVQHVGHSKLPEYRREVLDNGIHYCHLLNF